MGRLTEAVEKLNSTFDVAAEKVGRFFALDPQERPGSGVGPGVPGPRRITARDTAAPPIVVPPGWSYDNGVLIPGPPAPPYSANNATRATGAGGGASGAPDSGAGAGGGGSTAGGGDTKLATGGLGIPSLVNGTLTVTGSTGAIEPIAWLNAHCKRSVKRIPAPLLAGTTPVPIYMDQITWDCGPTLGTFQIVLPRQDYESYEDQVTRGATASGGPPPAGRSPKITITGSASGRNVPNAPGSVFQFASGSSTATTVAGSTISADGRMLGDKLDRVAGTLDKINRGDGGLGLRQAAI